jgi:hypothetical protein
MCCFPACQRGRALIYHFVFTLPIRYQTTISNWHDPQKNSRHFALTVPAESVKTVHDDPMVLNRSLRTSENALSTAKMLYSPTTGMFRASPIIFPHLPISTIFAMNRGSFGFRYDQRHDGNSLA